MEIVSLKSFKIIPYCVVGTSDHNLSVFPKSEEVGYSLFGTARVVTVSSIVLMGEEVYIKWDRLAVSEILLKKCMDM